MSNDFQLHKTRFSAQSAEKLGWSIGAYSIAYALEGEIGIICFGLTMFFVASIFTIYFRKNDVKFGKDLLKQSILYRISSFSILIFAVMLENYHLLLLGSALSGIYVSMFWPSFYSLKRSSVSRWYVNEKFYACILLLVSGICISKFGPGFVIILASIAAIIAYFQHVDDENINYRAAHQFDTAGNKFEAGEKIHELGQCNSCHFYGKVFPTGDAPTWAPNLALTKERLNPEWVTEWLKNPQAIMPGTKMPAPYIPDSETLAMEGAEDDWGSALVALDGDTLDMLNGLRDYLWNVEGDVNIDDLIKNYFSEHGYDFDNVGSDEDYDEEDDDWGDDEESDDDWSDDDWK